MDYIGENYHSFLNKKPITSLFGGRKEYRDFVLDQADYQRSLEEIKHLTYEK